MKFPRRRFLRLAAGAAALPAVPSAPALGQGTIIPTNATLIVERTQYFANGRRGPRCTTQGYRRAPLDRASSR